MSNQIIKNAKLIEKRRIENYILSNYETPDGISYTVCEEIKEPTSRPIDNFYKEFIASMLEQTNKNKNK